MVETKQYNQVIPYTDRLNYCSSLTNNVGFCKAVERLMGVEVPERTKYIRVIIMEIQRIMDHMICVGANLVDSGALTNFWYFFNCREKLNDVLEALTGARLTYSYITTGGAVGVGQSTKNAVVAASVLILAGDVVINQLMM